MLPMPLNSSSHLPLIVSICFPSRFSSLWRRVHRARVANFAALPKDGSSVSRDSSSNSRDSVPAPAREATLVWLKREAWPCEAWYRLDITNITSCALTGGLAFGNSVQQVHRAVWNLAKQSVVKGTGRWCKGTKEEETYSLLFRYRMQR